MTKFEIFKIEDKKQMTALHIACKNENDQLASLLINHTEVEHLCAQTDNFLLHLICKNKVEKYDIVKLILEKFRAKSAEENSKNYVELALSMEDSTRKPLIHIAVENNHLKLVEFLLSEYKANKEVREGKNGNLIMHTAAKTGSTDMLELLKRNDAVSKQQNNNLENALHVAVLNNRYMFIEKYLHYENNPADLSIECQCSCEPTTDLTLPSVQVTSSFLIQD